MAKHTGSTTAIQVLSAYMDVRELDSTALLAKYGWTQEQISNPLGQVPLNDALAFIAETRVVSGDPLFISRASTWAPLGSYHFLDYLLMSAPRICDGLTRAFRLVHMIDNRLKFEFEDTGEGPMRIALEAEGGPISEVEAQGFLPGYSSRVSMLAGVGATPDAVIFRSAAYGSVHELRELLGCDVLFDAPFDGLVISREVWEHPNQLADPIMFNFLDQLAFKVASPAMGMVQRVEQTIEQGLRLRRFDLGFVARSLRVSARTLQRRLSESDLSYQQLIERVRRRLAQRLITNTDLSISEIGTLLGIEHAASVTRAFKRWFGKTPSQMRQDPPLLEDDLT